MRCPRPAASSVGISRSDTWENCSVCLAVFRTSTCFVRSASWAPATGPNRHATSVVIHNAERRTPRGKVSMCPISELCFEGYPEEARRQDRIGPRPWCTRDEGAVVRKAGARVQRIVDIERKARARAAEPQNLGYADVQLVDAIAKACSRR